MRTRPIAGALLLVVLAGCDSGAPPFDDLPLRDALRADPAVIATLSDDARQRLAARLEAARTVDDASDPMAGELATTQPAVLVTQADAARAQRSSDALIVGTIGSGMARALPSTAVATPAPLPPLEVEATAPALTELESRALQGQGATLLRGLVAMSGAHHLRRVVGWPTGAVAIDDTVYAGAAWLAALAPTASADGGADAGAPAPVASARNDLQANAGTPATATAPSSGAGDNPDGGGLRATPATDNVGTPYGYGDGGVVVVYPPSNPQPTPTTSSDDSCSGGGAAADSCAACGAASTDDSDSCDGSTDDGSDDSCNNTDDGSSSDDSCNNTSGDGSDDTNCQVSRRSRQHGGTSPRMMLSLFAPLAFLFSRRQRQQ